MLAAVWRGRPARVNGGPPRASLVSAGVAQHLESMSIVAPTSVAGRTGLVFNIMRFALHDGPGIRTTVFLKGCPLRCWWCHNPESQSAEPEVVYFQERCIRCGECVRACELDALELVGEGNESAADGAGVLRGRGTAGSPGQLVLDTSRCDSCGDCADACPAGARQLAGRHMTVGEVLAEVAKDQVFFDQSGGGVTVSGGEPLMQAEFTEELLAACKARRLRTALDTCGLAHSSVLERVRPHVDLFLYDLKLMDAAAHLRYTGAKNDLILRNLALLAEAGSEVIVRMPVIPGVNDGEDNLDRLAGFMTAHGLRDIDLLPYHRIASDKYRRLHLTWRMDGVEPPTADHVELLAARLRVAGLRVRIGG